MYQTKLNKKLSLFSSVSYKLEGKLTSRNTRNISAVTFYNDLDYSIVQSLDDETATERLTLPSELKLGLGIGESKKWLVGAQVVAASQGDLANYYNVSSRVSYEKAMRYSIGGYFVPNYNSFTSYFKRIVYRAGIKYEETGLVMDSQSIKDKGVSFGFGLPITGSFSNINFGFELGKRGTTSSGLVQENYVKFSVGLSFNDRWFVKRKFD